VAEGVVAQERPTKCLVLGGRDDCPNELPTRRYLAIPGPAVPDERTAFHELRVQAQFVRVEEVIRVEDGDVPSRGDTEGDISRGTVAGRARVVDGADPGVGTGHLIHDAARTIARSIVHDDHLKVAERLTLDAPEGAPHGSFLVVGCDDDRHKRRRFAHGPEAIEETRIEK
jgi:hypothetical protein